MSSSIVGLLKVLEAVGVTAVLLLVLGIYFYSEVMPRLPGHYLRRLCSDYHKVVNGEISYHYFVNHYSVDCQILRPKDSPELREFKCELLDILQYEDFIRRTLSDSSMNYGRFIEEWKRYEPSIGFDQSVPTPYEEPFYPGDSIAEAPSAETSSENPIAETPSAESLSENNMMETPSAESSFSEGPSATTSPSIDSSLDILPVGEGIDRILSSEKGKEMMEKLVSLGYCEPMTYRWYEKHSSYLMALFAYAIMQELGNRRGDWTAFSRLWCSEKKNNLTCLRDQALTSTNSKSLIETVQKVFPNYDPDKR